MHVLTTARGIEFRVSLSAEGEEDPIVQMGLGGEKREFGPYEMSAKKGAGNFEGYYQGQVLADPKLFPAGDYEYFAIIDVPESASDTLQGKFQIVKSDPEMDNTKPDLARLLEMASEFDKSFQSRLTDKVKSEFASGLPKDNGVPKLAFKLGDKELIRHIPDCFTTKEQRADNRGPVNDLWDKGVEFPVWEPENRMMASIASTFSGKRLPISWVMLIVVTLLSWEWLTRKLLRLA
jgi:hypothetical protein